MNPDDIRKLAEWYGEGGDGTKPSCNLRTWSVLCACADVIEALKFHIASKGGTAEGVRKRIALEVALGRLEDLKP